MTGETMGSAGWHRTKIIVANTRLAQRIDVASVVSFISYGACNDG